MHTEQYDAFQVPYDLGHNPPYSSAEMAYIGLLRNNISTTLPAGIHPPNAAWSAACFQHCIRYHGCFLTARNLLTLMTFVL